MADMIAVVVGAMLAITFWRQLLILLSAVLIAVFCLGLINITQMIHH
jgi:hypothetical protein